MTAIAPAALALFKAYEFPGNVRELANAVERAVIVARGMAIEATDLPEAIRAAVGTQQRRGQKRLTLAQLEADYILETLAATRGNKSEAARLLGISRKNLYEKLARYEKGVGGRVLGVAEEGVENHTQR